MPAVQASIEYLQKLPLYEEEKPYWCFLAPHDGFDPDTQRVDNLEFEDHSDIKIQDIRELSVPPEIEDYGFEVLSHESKFSSFEQPDDIFQYVSETEQLLREKLDAVYVKCYDSQLRKNVEFKRTQFDLNDPMVTEGPARGAHNGKMQTFLAPPLSMRKSLISADITYGSGPVVINRHLPEDAQKQFLKPGYRVRIVNTWRALNPVIEDRPLALCDSHSVDPDDLVAADRIIPAYVGEVYYLTHNPKHRWFWLERQTPSEPFVFVMYDTKAGDHARFCPHVSFVNPKTPEGAAPRESIETRSIVITKE